MQFLIVAASLLLAANGAVFPRPQVPQLDGKIVGGVPANISEARYQVALLMDYFGTGSFAQTCGGSIISPTVVVTAAHCTDGTTAGQWRIRAGSSIHNSGGQVVPVSRIVQHSGFSSRLDNDISLLFLAKSLVLGPNVGPIKLPYQNQPIADGSNVLVTGWGVLEEDGRSPTGLYKVTIPTINQQLCAKAYANFNPITNNMICAGRLGVGGQDACQGDSGGPMAMDGTLVGITSWGRGCAQSRYPGVWTRVAAYSVWINSNM